MKKFLIVVLAVVMVCGAAFAQDFQPAAKSGAKSLNFTFAGIGTFGIGPAGVNGGFGVSYFMSNDAALRLGLQIKSNSSTQPYNDPNPPNTPGSDGSASTFGLGLGVDYLMYMYGMTPRVKPYMGLGAFVLMNSSDTKFQIATAAADGTPTETKNGNGEGLSFGLAGIAGAEFFIYPELSFSAEYQLNLIAITSKSDKVASAKNKTDVTTKQGGSTQILGFGTVGAILHIYF